MVPLGKLSCIEMESLSVELNQIKYIWINIDRDSIKEADCSMKSPRLDQDKLI